MPSFTDISQLFSHQPFLCLVQLTHHAFSAGRASQRVVAGSHGDSGEPRDERSLPAASVGAKREIGVRKTLLHDILHLLATIKEAISEAGYGTSVALEEERKGRFVSRAHSCYQLIVHRLMRHRLQRRGCGETRDISPMFHAKSLIRAACRPP